MVSTIRMLDRDEFLRMQSEEGAIKPDAFASDARAERIAEMQEDAEIAKLRETIKTLQADLAIKEEELQALVINTLAGEKQE